MNEVISIREALNRAHHQLMEGDGRIVVIGEDIVGGAGIDGAVELGGVFGVTAGLAARFGTGRVIDTPISEAAFVGMGVGAAMTGLRPIVELMFCDFLGVAFDQILNQAAKARFLSNGRLSVPLTIRTSMGAGDGSGAMHSQSLYGLLMQVPGLVVACPATPADAAGLLKSAVRSEDPVVLFEHKNLFGVTGPVDPGLPAVPFGKARIVRGGTDVTVVALGAMVGVALEAADTLAAEGVSLEVIDPRTIQPLDYPAIAASVAKTGKLVVVDEGTDLGGFADSLVSRLCREDFATLRAAPITVTPPRTPVPYARAAEKAWLPDAARVAAAIRSMI